MSALIGTSFVSPLNPAQVQQLQGVLSGLTPAQMAWLGGYISGLAFTGGGHGVPVAVATGPADITILVGSQTGNCEKLAKLTHERAGARGFRTVVKKMGDYKLQQLKQEKHVLVIISTQGEGDPPDNAKEMIEFLFSKRAPQLKGMDFAVLGLGDSSYEHFCKMGVEVDRRLGELGATRLVDRVDCDVDYDDKADAWIEVVLQALAGRVQADPVGSGLTGMGLAPLAPTSVYSRRNPFPAVLLEDIVLNGRGSAKETHHIELSLEGSGLVYEPGDALGVYPVNPPEVVEQLLAVLAMGGHEDVLVEKEKMNLREAFSRHLEITTITRPVLQKYADLAGSKKLAGLLKEDKKEALQAYIGGRDLVDLVSDYPLGKLDPQVLVAILRKLPPRLYSIASSLKQHPDEVHLTVAAVRYERHGRARQGVCSTYLADRVGEGGTLPVYVDTNSNFKLPSNLAAPVIMIGPGTGIAPFRAFIEERDAVGASGKNWLFFGDQHFTTDFLYQTEWQRYHKSGVLNKISLAFSRDQAQKVYVQQRMLEESRAFYAWLQEGAYVYVCGDEKHMAHDVHNALIDLVAKEGPFSREHAEEYVKLLQKENRYLRDVY